MAMQANHVAHSGDDKLSLIILQKKLLSTDAFLQIQKQAIIFQQTVFQYIMQYRCIDPDILLTMCVEYLFSKKLSPTDEHINYCYCDEMPEQFLKNTLALPIKKNEKQLTIAIANPNDFYAAKNLSFQMDLIVEIQFTRYDTLCRLHNAYMGNRIYKNKDAQEITHHIFGDAIHRGASDIHVEPYHQHLRVRFRIDGLLHEIIRLSNMLSDAIISCVKILAQLDIAIKRMPQDGRLTFRSYLGFVKECRVSTCPTVHGEKIVIRLLDANTNIRPIHDLGLTMHDQKIVKRAINQPQGLILVTGPTGSGKTITLYTLLNLLNEQYRNIATIEDPVEMHIDGISQTHVNAKTGLTFSQTLRALLRQDPDVIMLGEIRDQETAEMAIRAAQTGHLVLSTLHTNSAPEAITRLIHMGIAPFHLTSALTLIIAQRLVRQLCVYCKTPQQLSTQILFNAGFSNNFTTTNKLFEASGCAQCTRGFSGRIGIYEILPISNTIRQLLLNHASYTEIAQQNYSDGHCDLWHAGLQAVTQGITSLHEIYRVIPSTPSNKFFSIGAQDVD